MYGKDAAGREGSRIGGIRTPEVGVLEDVTRKTVVGLANELGFPVGERAVPAEELGSADEVFATSTAGGVMPITTIDGEAVDGGSPGPMTLRLREAYWEAHEDPRFATPVEYDRPG